jgi:hypothetical protein
VYPAHGKVDFLGEEAMARTDGSRDPIFLTRCSLAARRQTRSYLGDQESSTLEIYREHRNIVLLSLPTGLL